MNDLAKCIVIGYGGHSYVALEILINSGLTIKGYCDREKKTSNPYNLIFLGDEQSVLKDSQEENLQFFVAVGSNYIRSKIFDHLSLYDVRIVQAIHAQAFVSNTATVGIGVFVAANASINAMCRLGNGVICNTGSVVDHECKIGDFSHIAPGVVLCGNVTVGRKTFIGANTTVKPGIIIGDGVVVGAGSTVVKDILQPGTYYGSPAKFISA